MKKIFTRLDKTDKTTNDGNLSSYSENIGKIFHFKNNSILIESIIAEGGFSVVYLAKNETSSKNEPKYFALKRILVNDKNDLEICMREIEIMKAVSSLPNFITMIDYKITKISKINALEEDNVYEILILMSYYHGSLLQLINEHLKEGKNGLEEDKIIHIFLDICLAVSYLHSFKPYPIIHRDLKIENILKDSSNGHFVLCDFGSCIYDKEEDNISIPVLEENIKKYTTLAYRSPEMVDLYLGLRISTKADIWALGCMLYKMCYMTTPFGENILAIYEGKFTFPSVIATAKYSNQLKSLIRFMLIPDPNERPDIFDVLKLVRYLNNSTKHFEARTTPGSQYLTPDDVAFAKRVFNLYGNDQYSPVSEIPRFVDPPVLPIQNLTNIDYSTSIKPRERPKAISSSSASLSTNKELKLTEKPMLGIGTKNKNRGKLIKEEEQKVVAVNVVLPIPTKRVNVDSQQVESPVSQLLSSTDIDAFEISSNVPVVVSFSSSSSVHSKNDTIKNTLLTTGFEDSFNRLSNNVSPAVAVGVDKVMHHLHPIPLHHNNTCKSSCLTQHYKGSMSSISNVKSRESLIMSISSTSSVSSSRARSSSASHSLEGHLIPETSSARINYDGEDSTELLGADEDEDNNHNYSSSKTSSISSALSLDELKPPLNNNSVHYFQTKTSKDFCIDPPSYSPPPLPDYLDVLRKLDIGYDENGTCHDRDEDFDDDDNPFENLPFQVPPPPPKHSIMKNLSLNDNNNNDLTSHHGTPLITPISPKFDIPFTSSNGGCGNRKYKDIVLPAVTDTCCDDKNLSTLSNPNHNRLAKFSPTKIEQISEAIIKLNAQEKNAVTTGHGDYHGGSDGCNASSLSQPKKELFLFNIGPNKRLETGGKQKLRTTNSTTSTLSYSRSFICPGAAVVPTVKRSFPPLILSQGLVKGTPQKDRKSDIISTTTTTKPFPFFLEEFPLPSSNGSYWYHDTPLNEEKEDSSSYYHPTNSLIRRREGNGGGGSHNKKNTKYRKFKDEETTEEKEADKFVFVQVSNDNSSCSVTPFRKGPSGLNNGTNATVPFTAAKRIGDEAATNFTFLDDFQGTGIGTISSNCDKSLLMSKSLDKSTMEREILGGDIAGAPFFSSNINQRYKLLQFDHNTTTTRSPNELEQGNPKLITNQKISSPPIKSFDDFVAFHDDASSSTKYNAAITTAVGSCHNPLNLFALKSAANVINRDESSPPPWTKSGSPPITAAASAAFRNTSPIPFKNLNRKSYTLQRFKSGGKENFLKGNNSGSSSNPSSAKKPAALTPAVTPSSFSNALFFEDEAQSQSNTCSLDDNIHLPFANSPNITNKTSTSNHDDLKTLRQFKPPITTTMTAKTTFLPKKKESFHKKSKSNAVPSSQSISKSNTILPSPPPPQKSLDGIESITSPPPSYLPGGSKSNKIIDTNNSPLSNLPQILKHQTSHSPVAAVNYGFVDR